MSYATSNGGNKMKIHITKNDLTNKLKSKYFIVILSSEENLQKCINNNIAGFPKTDNGRWAYLDINKGDYISFYYNGRIFNLYQVNKKFIPDEFKKKEMGNEEYDPVALSDNKKERWRAIITKKGNIYFPYRLSLSLEAKTEFNTSLIFKNGFERFGINLVPRVSLKKSHFQLSVNDIEKIFNRNVSPNQYEFTWMDFKEVTEIRSDSKSIVSIADITTKEIFLQSLLKRILESSVDKYSKIFHLNSGEGYIEFFSEQTVYGGEADIVIANYYENLAFIEVKNGTILNKKGKLTRLGEEACKQVKSYKDIINPKKKIKKFIAGKGSMKDNIILKIIKEDDIYVIEINSEFNIA